MDETDGKPMYSFATKDSEVKKAKGVSKSVVKNEISLNDYINVFMDKSVLKVCQNSIRSFKHQVNSISQQKIALSGINTKYIYFRRWNCKLGVWPLSI
jgi:hypothetical protein